ncbi:hypothetical protein HMPREF0519_0931 [Lentilactobacillus hilgardii DSM 20176 = ATCC 8290]|uniref:Uncharacterized protein n=1 Tax=Lentilactobacillus hilgardii (strain ATCC 8290 / DSM 20176 / CCUG 30140 / JCM 1155 / KCTC 3500 / NBRC 15886 / NCIMB 8040 / NRRL B-1843 / 9) TaxID=1423757 RepID=C0XI70_LENH9|nr:hypothetical protein HMPREF0519_0931 [Lentilactobacillus hilgardii DSM 20176 = ATCC 8290]
MSGKIQQMSAPTLYWQGLTAIEKNLTLRCLKTTICYLMDFP